MAVDKEKLREYLDSIERGDFTISDDAIEKFNIQMDALRKEREERDRNQREFLTSCRCHTGMTCYFHTQFM